MSQAGEKRKKKVKEGNGGIDENDEEMDEKEEMKADEEDGKAVQVAVIAEQQEAKKIGSQASARSLDNRFLIRAHYIHLFCKGLAYLALLNLLIWTPLVHTRYRKRGRSAIRQEAIIWCFYLFAMCAPFVQLACFLRYLSQHANVPDPVTLAKWIWPEAFETLVRNEPKNRDVIIHAVDRKGRHLFYILMNNPIDSGFTKSYKQVFDMVQYLMDVGDGIAYLHTFYVNHADQAKELLKRIAIYSIDVSLMFGAEPTSILASAGGEADDVRHEVINGKLVKPNKEPMAQAQLVTDFRRMMGLFRSLRSTGNFDRRDCLRYFRYVMLTLHQVMPADKISHVLSFEDRAGAVAAAGLDVVNPVTLIFEQLAYVCGTYTDTYRYLLLCSIGELDQFMLVYLKLVAKCIHSSNLAMSDYYQSSIGAIVRCLTSTALCEAYNGGRPRLALASGDLVVYECQEMAGASAPEVGGGGVSRRYALDKIKDVSDDQRSIATTSDTLGLDAVVFAIRPRRSLSANVRRVTVQASVWNTTASPSFAVMVALQNDGKDEWPHGTRLRVESLTGVLQLSLANADASLSRPSPGRSVSVEVRLKRQWEAADVSDEMDLIFRLFVAHKKRMIGFAGALILEVDEFVKRDASQMKASDDEVACLIM